MCTKPHPLIVYQIPGEEKKRTIFLRNYPDEAQKFGDIERNMNVLKDWNPELVTVACGKCYECRLQYSRVWANRCVMESLLYEHNYFLTLTYSPEKCSHLLNEYGALSLSKTDCTFFMKKLRRYFEYNYNFTGIRFYLAGEYGEENMRPHYHILLFNCPIPDLEQIACNKFGDALFHSQIIEDLWGFGFVCIGALNWNTCAYTARYVLKKIKGNTFEMYEDLKINPEFTRMSRMPGIGKEFFTLNFEDIYAHTSVSEDGKPLFKDSIVLPSNGDKPNIVKPPRYFDNELEKIDPDRLAEVKLRRREWQKIAEDNRKSLMPLSDREYFEFKDDCIKKQKIGMMRKFQDLC